MFGKKKPKEEFTIEVAKKGAWENAPKLIDKDPDEYRVCMYCQFPLKHDMFVEDMPEGKKKKAWTIDIINLAKPGTNPDNLLAIHNMCMGSRQKDNEKSRLKRYQNTKWMYPKNIK